MDAGLGADGFDSPGPYIKAQRRRKNMSLEQLAAATKIPRKQLEMLEADRYEELPGMVFAKGFLRCCARSLELDPDTVLGLFYERERAQLQARRREPADKITGRVAGPAIGRGAGRAALRSLGRAAGTSRPGGGRTSGRTGGGRTSGGRPQISASNPIPPRSKRAATPRASGIQAQISAQISAWLSRLPSARILMWILVALFVALIVFIAFTLASSQAETLMIRS